jgi:uncharacterized membrane protein
VSDERYAPPQARLQDEGSLSGGTGTFDIGLAVRQGWDATWPNFWVLLGAGIVASVLAVLSFLTVVGAFLVVPVLAWGMIRLALNALDGKASFGDLWSGFSDYGRALVTMLVLYILQTLLNALGQSVSTIGEIAQAPSLTFIGIAVLVAWTFFVTARLNFAWLYAVDQRMGPVEALQAAWDATAQQKVNCMVLFILSLVIPLIGVLGLVILVIPASMIAFLMQVSAYRQMVGRRSAAS